MNLLIENNVGFHYEIIESVIIKYDTIIKKNKNENINIYLNVRENPSFINYLKNKYPSIKINQSKNILPDYYINCTIYDKGINSIKKNSDTHFYISHEITDRLKNCSNVIFLSPLCQTKNYIYADVLPFTENIKRNDIPIYIIQGNYTSYRRNYNLLKKILDETYDYEYKIKLLGKGTFPKILENYKNKIIVKRGLNFVDYHKEFLDGYCIIPLIIKKTHSQYYTKKLSSSINYGLAYKLKFLIDQDLQNIYNLDDVEVFDDIDNIVQAFKKTLIEFYTN